MRRSFPVLLLALLGGASCVSPLQQYVTFGHAPVWPTQVAGDVGDIVTFEIRPEVAAGTTWSLHCGGRVRFVEAPTSSSLDWTASPHAVRLETVISPWDPRLPDVHTSREWLWYSMREEGESSPLDRELPIHRVAYRELAPVTVASTFAPDKETPELSMTEQGGRVIAHYRTGTRPGVPRQPFVEAMLLESGNKTILYAEVHTDVGTTPKEPTGYDVALSYDKSRVRSEAEIVVVGWLGNDDYWKPFTVVRSRAGAASSIPEIPPEIPKPAAPSHSGAS